jgi:hypothetical protein
MIIRQKGSLLLTKYKFNNIRRTTEYMKHRLRMIVTQKQRARFFKVLLQCLDDGHDQIY